MTEHSLSFRQPDGHRQRQASVPLIQRHPILVGVAAGVALVGFLGLSALLWRFVQGRIQAGASSTAAARPDTEPPAVVRVQPRVNLINLAIAFSEPIAAENAEDLASYTVAGARPVAAQLDASRTNVELTLPTPLELGSTITLTLSNIQDLAAHTMAVTEIQVKAPVLTRGFLRADYYLNLPWHEVNALTGDPRFPNRYDLTLYRTTSTAPSNFGDNYGLRLWGFFLPPTNGNYTFYLRSDDESELYLSSDADPANKVLVTGQAGAGKPYQSAQGTVSGLRAGQMYFFEALLKEGGGEDYLTVVCKAEGEPPPIHNSVSVTPIASAWLACYSDAQGVSVDFLESPVSTNLVAGQTASFSVLAKVVPADLTSSALYQWQRSNGAGGHTNIPGATARRFRTPPLNVDDNGASFACVVTVPGATMTSRSATVTMSAASPQPERSTGETPPARAIELQSWWPQFRGPNGQGVVETANPPIHFGASSNLLWTVTVPPGHSSPCVWGGRIFLTAFQAGQLETHGYDRATGKQVWRQIAPAPRVEKVRSFNSPASSTPVVDASRVFVYFGSYGVLCYSHDGKELWRKPLPTPKNQYGTASSPILHRDALLLVLDSDDRTSKLVTLRAQDGELDWQTDRPAFTANWSTPIVWDHDGQNELVILGSRRLVAYHADSGQESWWVDGFSPETIGVPVLGDGLLFVSAANRTGGHTDKYQGFTWTQLLELDRNGDKTIQRVEVPDDLPWILRPDVPKDNPGRADPNSTLKSRFNSIDADKDGVLTEGEWEAFASQWGGRFAPSLKAIRPRGSGGLTGSNVVWQLRRGIPEIPSPLYYRGRLFLVRDGGSVQCVRPANGEVIYDERVEVPGGYCASPVAAGGRIYLASHSGTIVVLDGTADRLRVLARNPMKENTWATPALVENTIYVRTEKHLHAFSRTQ